jgi:beta-lactamase class A
MIASPALLRSLARRVVAKWARSPRSLTLTVPVDIHFDTAGGLEAALARISLRAGAKVGVAAMHLENGLSVSFNGSARFPMASIVKIPIAVQLLALVEQGLIQPDRIITLAPHHIHPGHGLLERFRVPGVAFSIHNLFDLMLTESDNSAADILFDLAGGAAGVTGRLRALGIADISVDRSTIQLLGDAFGADMPADTAFTRERWSAILRATPMERRVAARRAFFTDPRDTVTPNAMVQLLAAIWHGKALGQEKTALLLDTMRRCSTGARRLKRLLPSGIRVAHKTGSMSFGISNDVGIVELPNNAGHIAIAVFVTESNNSMDELDWLIARIARTVYKSFFVISARAKQRPATRTRSVFK